MAVAQPDRPEQHLPYVNAHHRHHAASHHHRQHHHDVPTPSSATRHHAHKGWKSLARASMLSLSIRFFTSFTPSFTHPRLLPLHSFSQSTCCRARIGRLNSRCDEIKASAASHVWRCRSKSNRAGKLVAADADAAAAPPNTY